MQLKNASGASDPVNPKALAAEIDAELRRLPVLDTPHVRLVRRRYSQWLQNAGPGLVLDTARELISTYGYRCLPYELIRYHPKAFQSLDEDVLEALGKGMHSWEAVDSFARTLAGPAWLRGQVPDEAIYRWAGSGDRWWRRAALVSTVALNVRSHGGPGDTPRTLEICRRLVDDHDDMVVKALSWALRELLPHDVQAVSGFLAEYEERLAARVKREVRNKMDTGLKTPKNKVTGSRGID
jgi:3-methyladenine DNA glycosylase AlkD